MNDQPRPPIRPRRPAQPDNFGTVLAVMALLFLAGGMILLLGIVTGSGFFMIPVIILGTILAGMLHYVLWGRLLAKMMAKKEEQDTKP